VETLIPTASSGQAKKSDQSGPPLSAASKQRKGLDDFSPLDLRIIFGSQARLLSARAERGLRVDSRSVANLLLVFDAMVEAGDA